MMLHNLKRPRSPLREPLANLLRLYGYNWRPARSIDGKLWNIYKRGVQDAARASWSLHNDAKPENVLAWLKAREGGQWVGDGRLLVKT